MSRGVLSVSLSLSVIGFAASLTRPAVPRVVATSMRATTTTAAAPSTTTTTSVPPVVRSTAPPPPRLSESDAHPPVPIVRKSSSSGAAEPCGWTWDAIRVDDGSSNELTVNLDAARRPNEAVTIIADFAGPDSPTATRTVTTDGAGQASATFSVSEDKRDWTITVSATFAAGGACPAETFTLDY